MIKTYLGDGLYVEFEGYQYKLYTSDGERITNVIYLDPDVLASFLAFIKRVDEARNKPREQH